jgi:hypothetical protein
MGKDDNILTVVKSTSSLELTPEGEQRIKENERKAAEYRVTESLVLEDMAKIGFTFDKLDDRIGELSPYPIELYEYILEEIERGRNYGVQQGLVRVLSGVPVQSRKEFEILRGLFPHTQYLGHDIGIVFDNKTFCYPDVKDWVLEQAQNRDYGDYFLSKLNHYVSVADAESCCIKAIERNNSWSAADALATYGTARGRGALEAAVLRTKGETKRAMQKALNKLNKRLISVSLRSP